MTARTSPLEPLHGRITLRETLLYTETHRLSVVRSLVSNPYLTRITFRLVHDGDVLCRKHAELDTELRSLVTNIEVEVPAISFSQNVFWDVIAEQMILQLSRLLKEQGSYNFH